MLFTSGDSISDLACDNIQVPHLAIATDSSVSRLIPNGVIMSKVSPNLHPMALTLAIGRWSDLTPSLASGESVQRLMGDLNSQNKISELLEVVAAIVVTAGLVAGKLLLFSPSQVDNRIKALGPLTQPGPAARPVFW